MLPASYHAAISAKRAAEARPVPTVAAAVLLDAIEIRCGWTRDDRAAVEARCDAWARNNGRATFDVADVRFITKEA